MLELVVGAAGCGKTFYAREAVKNAALSGERPVLIVPEQFSLESERAMLELLGAENAGLAAVYSFSRLAELLGGRAGGRSVPRLDDCGRAAAMCTALSAVGDRLKLYRSSRSSMYIEHMLDAVKEFKLYSVTPDMLSGASAKAGGTLKDKLSDLSLVLGAYDAVVANCAADPLDDLSRLAQCLDDNRFFVGRTVIIDSFRSFTGQQLGVIDRMISQSSRCVVTICAETLNADPDSLFAPSLRTAEKLRQLAAKHSVSVKAPVYLARRRRFGSPALETVEGSIYRYGGQRLTYDEPTGDLTICAALDRIDEVEYCAAECRRLLREEGYRCRDIAVIARSEEAYSVLVEDAMEQQGLPCFIDRRINASCGAPMQLVSAALDCAVNGKSTESVIRLLKTGMIENAGDEDIAEFENYCYTWNIKGRELSQPFTQSPDGLDAACEASLAVLERVERLRRLVCGLIDELSDSLKGSSGRQMAVALYRFIEDSGAARVLEDRVRKMDVALADEIEQLWTALMRLLDQAALLIGDAHISPADFAGLIDVMISRCDIGHIPRGLDEITFGGAERIRVTEPKAVFVLGLLDGEFPAPPSGSGVFTDEERRRLIELDIPAADDSEAEMLNERMLVYTTLASAGRRLYAVYPKRSESGAQPPSECVSELLKCVPGAKFVERSPELSLEDIEAPAAAFDLAARSWLSDSETAGALKYALASDGGSGRLAMLAEESAGEHPMLRSSGSARKLFGDKVFLSPSSLETFYSCRYKYLCRYGMGLKERRKASIDALAYGSVAHYVLQCVFSRYTEDDDLLRLCDFDTVRGITGEIIERYISEHMETAWGADAERLASLLYRVRNMKTPVAYLAVNIARELSSGDFRPRYFERAVSEQQDIPADGEEGGMSVTVKGVVDRVDICKINGREYLRVIDYKTGRKSFRLSDVLEGFDMQMLIYLSQLTGKGDDSPLPAGVLYCPATPGVAEGAPERQREDIIKKQQSDFKRKGIIIDDIDSLEVARAMERGLKGEYIPVRTKDDGQIYSYDADNVISGENFDLIRRYIRKKILSAAKELRCGGFAPSPVNAGFDICGNCPYRPICRYYLAPRKLKKMSGADTLESMKNQLTGDTDGTGNGSGGDGNDE